MKIRLCGCLIVACVSIFSIVSCGKRAGEDTSAEVAGRAARAYYDQLLHGDYNAFVAGRYQPDSIPAAYHEQLVANAKMFLGQQNGHGGIKEVKFVSARADTSKHVADVFLTFAYGDGTAEEVVVPMVQHKGVWYMR